MVAIHVLVEPDDWPELADEVGPTLEPALVPERRRRLPDRATRIRRRRLAVLLLALALGAVVTLLVDAVSGSAGGAGASSGSAGEEPPAPITEPVYVVQPGDTLWSIAERLRPHEDPRQVVAEIRAANGDADLDVGDRLLLRPE